MKRNPLYSPNLPTDGNKAKEYRVNHGIVVNYDESAFGGYAPDVKLEDVKFDYQTGKWSWKSESQTDKFNRIFEVQDAQIIE